MAMPIFGMPSIGSMMQRGGYRNGLNRTGDRPVTMQQAPYTPTGPLQTLPQNPWTQARGATPLKYSAMTGSMLGGPSNTPSVAPGNGSVFVHDNEYNPTPGMRRDVDAYVARDRGYGAAAGSGPYDSAGALGRFQSLPGAAPLRPRWTPGPGESYQTGHLDAADASRRVAQGRAAAYVSTGGPAYGLTADQKSRRQAAIGRQRDQKAGLAEGRRNRAIAQNGMTWLQPTQNYTYDTGIGRTGGYVRSETTGSAPSPTIAGLVSRNTVEGEGTDWGGVSRGVYDDPKFKQDPKAAWDSMRRGGATSADIAGLIDDAEGGVFGIGADQDPAYTKWIQDVGRAAGIHGPATQSPQQGTPSYVAPNGFNPNDPGNSILGMLPDIGFNPFNPFNPFPMNRQRRLPVSPPPPTPALPRGPIRRPNF